MPKTPARGRQTPATRQIVPTGTSAPATAQKAVQGAVDKAAALKELASRQLAKRRLLPFIQRMNPRYLAGWVHEDICRRLERFSDDVEKGLSPRLMLLMPPRHGKACAVGTPVPTPGGFKPIETLVPGDFVFGRDGRPTRVVAVSPIWHDRELFEVVSDDGAEVVVDAEHEWTTRLCRKRPVYKTKTTRGLYERTGERKPALMTYGAAEYPELALPIKPYVLGAWLGDGCSQHATMTQGAQDFAFMRAELEKEGVVTSDRATAGTFGLLGLQLPLRQLGLLNNKHIPEMYLRASTPQRHALLQGLIDTDGHVAPDGQVEFCAVNEQLAYQVLALVRSLGVKASMILGDATLNGTFISKKYRVMFYMAGAARMPRKAARCRNGVRSPHRFISIKPAGRGDTVCIQVEAQDHQYLVGHGYLLTHNSEIASKTFPAWHLGRFPDHEIIACSYNVGLAMGFSRKVQQLFDDPAYQNVFDARLNPNHRAAEEWGVHGRLGGYVAAGVGGGITGKGAHVLIIDDPIKNAEEADSADTREKLWDWYGSTAYTRLAPGAGVLVIQCMTGETPVLLPSGEYRRLDEIRAGDSVATYEAGRLTAATVAAWKSSGHDQILKITMSSGKVVRANGRHPFMVSTDEGLKWIRARSLTTAHKIVACKDSGESGKEKPAQRTDASCPPNAADCAPRTTTRKNGPTVAARPLSTQNPAALRTSSTATVSPQKHTPDYSLRKGASALFAAMFLLGAPLSTGATASVSIIVTKRAKYGHSYAMIATPQSDTFALNQSLLPPPSICDFMEDRITSIELDGVEEVFDVQVNHTGNFIANGLVSHNTWWHDDDLAGKLQQAMASDAEADQFEIIKYPALADTAEFLNEDTDEIVRIPMAAEATAIFDPAKEASPNIGPALYASYLSAASFNEAKKQGHDITHYKFLRAQGAALHAERYDVKKLRRIKAVIPTRFWSALYQQNPVPDDGSYFTKDQFKRGPLPSLKFSKPFIAWDFAISEKKVNDYTVGTVGLQDTDDVLHAAEVVRFKSGNAFFIVESILNLAKRWYHPSLTLGFEDGQIYRSIEALLKKRMRELKFYPSIVVLRPITDKLARARVLQGRMQQGMVSFSQDGAWYDTVRNEMLRFPAGVHDDCVDSMAWMAQMVVDSEPPRGAKPKEQKSWKDRLTAGKGATSHMAA